MTAAQVSVIGSGAEHEERAEEVGRLLAEIGFALTLGRRTVVLEPGWEVDGALRAKTPREAVDFALATCVS